MINPDIDKLPDEVMLIGLQIKDPRVTGPMRVNSKRWLKQRGFSVKFQK